MSKNYVVYVTATGYQLKVPVPGFLRRFLNPEQDMQHIMKMEFPESDESCLVNKVPPQLKSTHVLSKKDQCLASLRDLIDTLTINFVWESHAEEQQQTIILAKEIFDELAMRGELDKIKLQLLERKLLKLRVIDQEQDTGKVTWTDKVRGSVREFIIQQKDYLASLESVALIDTIYNAAPGKLANSKASQMEKLH